MGQVVGGLWDRAQGKCQVRRICDKIYNQWPEKNMGNLATKDLYVLTLMVYNSVNKQLLSPHKEPPRMEVVQDKVKALSAGGTELINQDKFYEIIINWIQKDLHIVLANRIAVSLLAAPLLAVLTKNAGRQFPSVRKTVDKVPTPVIASAYSVGILFLQDIRME